MESDIESWSELKDIQQKRPPSLKNKKQSAGRKIRNPKQEKTTLTGWEKITFFGIDNELPKYHI